MRDLVDFVQDQLSRLADPDKAAPMAAYMKTEMPFYGVQTPERRPIAREMNRRYAPANRDDYEAAVLALWQLPHREEKYLAISYASSHQDFINGASLPLYETLVRTGAWWDFVDSTAIKLVGGVLAAEMEDTFVVLDRWITDPDLWIRRTAIISQIGMKEDTDSKRLFAYCLSCAAEKEFFIRKGIGWALREYSCVRPDAVRAWLLAHRDALSGLSFREGAKALRRKGLMD